MKPPSSIRVADRLFLADGCSDSDGPTVRIGSLKGVVFDLDGTLVRGPHALPGACAAVEKLRTRGLRIAYCTQDTIQTPAVIAERLEKAGFAASPNDVVTTGWLAAGYLAARYGDDPVYLIGAPELRRNFAAQGVNIVDDRNCKTARAVFVGSDPAFTKEHVKAACRAIWNGADFYGVGYDRVLPIAGRNVPASGGLIKAIEYTTRRRARILGKPSREIAAAALRRIDALPGDAVVVGDNVDTDIRMGKSAGCLTALVLTGASSDAISIPARWQPDTVLADVGLLPDWLATVRG
jgi:HAD superfamily hydrolase (TIGR01450 family)